MRGSLAVILAVAGGVLLAPAAAACPRQNDGLCDEPYFSGATGLCPINSDTADCADLQVWWGSDETAIDAAELFGLEPGRARLARNEIFARHGRRFQSADLQGFFALRSWYRPAEGEPALSAVEKGNVALFKAEEEAAAAGLPHASGMPRPLASFSAEVVFDDGMRLAVEQVEGRERQVETAATGELRERLVLGDRREIWDLYRADGQATVYSPWYDPRVLLRLPAMLVLLEPVLEGTETLLGESALRFRLDWEDPEGAFWDGLVWVSADGIVLKAEVRFRAYEGDSLYDGEVRFELRNLKREALEPVVPPGDLAVGFAG